MHAIRHLGVDGRRVLIYTHRWLGIAGGLIFLLWFASGIVMMYQRLPRLSAEERLARLPMLVTDRIRIGPGDAARALHVAPDRLRVAMLGDRPVYRLEQHGSWSAVFADTGEALGELPPDAVLEAARHFFPEHAPALAIRERLDEPDQWLLDGGLASFLPLYRLTMGDAAGTEAYLSAHTGDMVMKTTRRGRLWGYLGAVLHWTYFTPFRRHREIWRYTIIYTAMAGAVMCLSGLVVGLWRFSPSARFRLKRQASHSPYAGWMWWHHYAGLLFGLFSFTWALSGAMSLTPWDWTPWFDATAAQVSGIRGGPMRLDDASAGTVRAAIATLAATARVKEIEIFQFRGHLLATAYHSPTAAEAAGATNPDVNAAFGPVVRLPRVHAWLRADGTGTFDRLAFAELTAAARDAVPGAALRDATWITSYDAYYYDRWGAKPLPVLRARFADADATWLYLDPATGVPTLRYTTRSRANRWLYNGLHSLDFPFLYTRRPLWDVVLVVLSAGGVALTITTLAPAWRRLRRHARAWGAAGV